MDVTEDRGMQEPEYRSRLRNELDFSAGPVQDQEWIFLFQIRPEAKVILAEYFYDLNSDVVLKTGLGLKTGFKTIFLRSWSWTALRI